MLLRESLGEGAWGYSTGLEYAQEAGGDRGGDHELCARSTLRSTRRTRAVATPGQRTPSPRRSASGVRPARAFRSRTSCRGTASRRAAGAIELVDDARDAGDDVDFDMHTRTFGLTHLYAALPPWALAAGPATLGARCATPPQRDRMRPHRSLLSAGGDWWRIVLLDNPFWPQYARARPRLDRGRARSRRRSTPSTTCCSAGPSEPHKLMVIINAYTEEQQREAFAHPLCVPGLRRDDARAGRPARAVVLPRRVHLGLVVLAFHGRGAAAALTRRGRAHRLTGQPAERIGLVRSRRPSSRSARGRRRLRPVVVRGARHDLRAEPARTGCSACHRERRADAARRGS